MSRAKVVALQLCEDKACPLRREFPKHALLERDYCVVTEEAATAVSYAWGEFERRQRVIGHFKDGSRASMELGEEWVLEDLLEALYSGRASMTTPSKKSWYWIDQLCINQDEPEEVQSTLAQIPKIFATFSVAILVPGERCECWTSWYESHIENDNDMTTEKFEGRTYQTGKRSCFNLMSINGYANRIWTRQEMIYASRMRMVWVQSSVAKCPTSGKGIPMFELKLSAISSLGGNTPAPVRDLEGKMSLLARRWYQKTIVDQGQDTDPGYDDASKFAICDPDTGKEVEFPPDARADIIKQIQEQVKTQKENQTSYRMQGMLLLKIHTIREELTGALQAWIARHRLHISRDVRLDPNLLFYDLLRGSEVDCKSFSQTSTQESPADEENLLLFLDQLLNVSDRQRVATKARDYVLSVWVDCPQYKVPSSFATMSAVELLFDAFKQLHRNFGLNLGTKAPQEMFELGEPDARNSFNQYLHSAGTESIAKAYGLLPQPFSYPFLTNSKELTGTGWFFKRHPAVITSTTPLRNDLAQATKEAGTSTIQVLMDMVGMFAREPQKRLMLTTAGLMGIPAFSTSGESPTQLLTLPALRNIDKWWTLKSWLMRYVTIGLGNVEKNTVCKLEEAAQKTPVDDMAFELACKSLGYDVDAARQAGLRLMVRTRPLMLGLTCLDLEKAAQGSTRTELYMPFFEGSDQDPCLAYEVRDAGKEDGTASDGTSAKIVGVWIPIRYKLAAKFGIRNIDYERRRAHVFARDGFGLGVLRWSAWGMADRMRNLFSFDDPTHWAIWQSRRAAGLG